METLLSLAGIAGALCCVGMYAAVSVGRISAERPTFFIVNGVGSILILIGCVQEFDMGDLGSIGQELIWAAISLAGLVRVWLKSGGAEKIAALRNSLRARTSAIAS
jgi:FtsH-binding integral membrane protein